MASRPFGRLLAGLALVVLAATCGCAPPQSAEESAAAEGRVIQEIIPVARGPSEASAEEPQAAPPEPTEASKKALLGIGGPEFAAVSFDEYWAMYRVVDAARQGRLRSDKGITWEATDEAIERAAALLFEWRGDTPAGTRDIAIVASHIATSPPMTDLQVKRSAAAAGIEFAGEAVGLLRGAGRP